MNPRTIRGLVAVAVIVAVVAATYGHLLGPFDFLTFLGAGRQVLHGHSPYPPVTSAVFRSGHGFVYPLFVAWLFAPLALCSTGIAGITYAGASVAAIVVSCRLLGRRDFAAAALVLVCSTTIIGLQMGTVNAFLLLGMAAAWHWRRGRPVLSGVALGMAAAAKLFLLPVLIWPLLIRRWSTGGAAVVTVVTLVGIGGFIGTESPSGYFHLLSQLQANEQVGSWSLSSLFQGAGLSRTGASAAALVVVAAGLAVVWRRRPVLGEGRLLGAMVVLSLLMSPIVWSSYLLLLAVPLLLLEPGDQVLAGAAVASWVIVTPDAASPARVAIGVVLAVAVAAAVLRPRLEPWAARVRARGQRPGPGPVRRLARPRPRSVLVPVAALAVAALMAAAPDQVAGPLPALLAMGLVGVRCLSRDRGYRLTAR